MSQEEPTTSVQWLREIHADVRATREYLQLLKEEGDREHRKLWAAIKGLKAALKNKPSKFVLLSNSKLAIALVGALIPASVSLYAIHTANSVASKVDTAEPAIRQTCEATKQLSDARLSALDRGLQQALRKSSTPAQRAAARADYAEAVAATPDVTC